MDISGDFEATTGLSIDDCITIGFALGAAAKQGGLSAEYLKNLPTGPHITEKYWQEFFSPHVTQGKLKKFLKLTSTDYRGFRQTCQRIGLRGAPLQIFDHNPLRQFPLIKPDVPIEGLQHILPVPSFLIERVSNGIYEDLFEKHQEADSSNQFSNSFGKVFERYVGHLLQAHVPSKHIIREQKYASPIFGGKAKGPDWLVIYGSCAVALECKSLNLGRIATTAGTLNEFERRLKGPIVECLEKLEKKVQDIRAGHYLGTEEMKITDVIGLIVTYHPVYLANSVLREKIVDTALRERGVHLSFEYQILDVEDWEHLAAFSSSVDLYSLLQRKIHDRVLKCSDFKELFIQLERVLGRHKNRHLLAYDPPFLLTSKSE